MLFSKSQALNVLIDYIMTDRPNIFLNLNYLNTGSDHRLIKLKAIINTRFERTEMVSQLKNVDTEKLQHHRREFQVKIQNRFRQMILTVEVTRLRR